MRRGLAAALVMLTLSSLALAPATLGEAPPGYALPGSTVAPGAAALVLAPSPEADIVIRLHAAVTGGPEDVFEARLTVPGVPWPFMEGYYAYLLPGLPYWNGLVETGNGARNVTLLAEAQVSYPGGSVRVEWRPGGNRTVPLAFLVAEGYTPYTLGLAPAGWSVPAGSGVNVTIIALGLGDRVSCRLEYGPPGAAAAAVGARPSAQWTAVESNVLSPMRSWLSSVEGEVGAAPGSLPRPVEGGAVCWALLPGLTPGSVLGYQGVAVDESGAQARTPPGMVWFHRRSGPQIVVVDDDVLLGLLAGVEWPEWPGGVLGDAPWLSSAANALRLARMLSSHDWGPLAQAGRLYIAFPGADAAQALSGLKPRLVYVSGLPPSAPGTPLDWSPWARDMARALEEAASRGAGVAASYSALADCSGLYPGVPDALYRLLGMEWARSAAAWQGAPCTMTPGAAAEFALEETPFAAPLGAPILQARLEAPVALGWQAGMLDGSRLAPEEAGDYAVGAWRLLASSGVFPREPFESAAEAAEALVQAVSRSPAGLEGLDPGELAWAYQDPAVPVYESPGAAVFAYDSGRWRGVYFAFEPEAYPAARPLLDWAARWLLSKPVPRGEAAGLSVPQPLVEALPRAPEYSAPATVWAPLVLDEPAAVAAQGVLLSVDDSARVTYTGSVASAGAGAMVAPAYPYPAAIVVVAPQPEAATQATGAETPTATTPPGGAAGNATATGSPQASLPEPPPRTPIVAEEPSPWAAVAGLAAAALAVAAAILYAQRRGGYSYY